MKTHDIHDDNVLEYKRTCAMEVYAEGIDSSNAEVFASSSGWASACSGSLFEVVASSKGLWSSSVALVLSPCPNPLSLLIGLVELVGDIERAG